MRQEQYRVHADLGLNHWWHYGTKVFFKELVRRTLPRGSHILDAGCGVGDMVVLLSDDYHMSGIDRSNDSIQHCIEKGLAKKVISGDVNELPFENESFNGILSLDVLYHQWISDDVTALKEMHRVLKPGGVAFIQLPAYEWLKSSHDEWAFSARRYTARRLKKLLAAAGFSKINADYRVSLLFPLAVVRRFFLKDSASDMKEINLILNSVFKLVIRLENFLLRYIRFPFGLSVIGVAEK